MKEIMIVTGAGSGLGREFAVQLAGTSAADEIWLFSRTAAALEETAARIKGTAPKNGAPPTPRVFPLDISGKQGVAAFERLLRSEAERAGTKNAGTGNGGPDRAESLRVTVLVNNAGFGTYGPVADTETEDQLDMIELNAVTLAGFCMAAIPYMGKGSRIINTASLAAFAPLGNFAVYAATKAFAHSFSLALAAELADKGISVCSVCPGPVATNFAAVASKGARMEVKNGADAAETVAHALRAVSAGKRQALMLFKWKLKAFLSRFIPRYAFARWTFIHEKRPRNTEAHTRD